MNSIELYRHNFVICKSGDIPYSANKLLNIFNIIVPHSKGGGNHSMCSGVYYDTEDNYYLNLYNKLICELIDKDLL